MGREHAARFASLNLALDDLDDRLDKIAWGIAFDRELGSHLELECLGSSSKPFSVWPG